MVILILTVIATNYIYMKLNMEKAIQTIHQTIRSGLHIKLLGLDYT